MSWRGLERVGVEQASPRPGPVVHSSGIAVRQMKSRGIEAERKHFGPKEKRGRNQKRWRKSPEPNCSVGWGTRFFCPTLTLPK